MCFVWQGSIMIHSILFSFSKCLQQVNRSEIRQIEWMSGIKTRRTFKERSAGVESWSDIFGAHFWNGVLEKKNITEFSISSLSNVQLTGWMLTEMNGWMSHLGIITDVVIYPRIVVHYEIKSRTQLKIDSVSFGH